VAPEYHLQIWNRQTFKALPAYKFYLPINEVNQLDGHFIIIIFLFKQ